VHGAFAGLGQLWRHRRRRRGLVGQYFELLLRILAPAPGGDAPSEAAVAIPQQ
jgi:hypothetical protein